MIRALFDTNLYVSYLLSTGHIGTTVGTLFERAFAGDFIIVAANAILEELLENVSTKPYLANRIDRAAAESFILELRSIAITPKSDPIEFVSIVRDPDDDVILAFALEERVDYLVSGDKDLLVLGEIFHPLKIRTPAAFLADLDSNP